MAMLFAIIAFSIDAMLPAMPSIATELSPEAPNRALLIVTSFVLGMGIGTLFTGPLSDAFGRKRVILGGALLYCVGAFLASVAGSLELLLAARIIQGLGAAGPRVVALAVVRDLYDGRRMARIMSLVFIVFSLVPAAAPALGQVIIWGTGWRGIFGAFILFAILAMIWMSLRLPETLPKAKRRSFSGAQLWAGLVEVLGNRTVRLSVLVQGLCLTMLFSVLSGTQPIFDQTYGAGETFPLWFAMIALLAASASIVNATLVERMGMRFMVTATLIGQIVISTTALILWNWAGVGAALSFAVFLIWTLSIFFQAGLTLGNINAIALEPMGHIAGMASSVLGAVSTVIAVALAAPISQAFDGTATPIAAGTLACAVTGVVFMQRLGRADAT
ncbi:multidrug effflux MFS transporter [Actibacterium sp. 188UL27-1]|nr:multidrug effflux MFS transporter [Actibacterium sp. 188UL27-1]MBM7069684.1 multidrug effflux MFS transporter [Actibacterium sp. 188UL27-1]